jgi:hypothetical protein
MTDSFIELLQRHEVIGKITVDSPDRPRLPSKSEVKEMQDALLKQAKDFKTMINKVELSLRLGIYAILSKPRFNITN